MQTMISELNELVTFKETTEPGDIVLIAAKEPQMLLYARVNSIERDPSRKDEWWHLKMSMLSLPPQAVTWTLRTVQMTGQEGFTMGGEERYLKAVQFDEEVGAGGEVPKKKRGKITSLKRVK